MSVTIATKDGSYTVGMNDTINLIVRASYANPSRGKYLYKGNYNYTVAYWDCVKRRRRAATFYKDEDAEAYNDTKWLTSEQKLYNVTVREMVADIEKYEKFFALAPQRIDYPAQDVPLPGFFLGVWLGDGTSTACGFATADKEILDYMTDFAKERGMNVWKAGLYFYRMSKNTPGSKQGRRIATRERVAAILADVDSGMYIQDIRKKYSANKSTIDKYIELRRTDALEDYFEEGSKNPVSQALQDLGIWGRNKKRIPEIYLRNSREVRLQVLAGIIDTDGHMKCNGYDMAFASRPLLEDVLTLARSLGYRCPEIVAYNAKLKGKEYPAFKSRICGGEDLMDIPVILPHKTITKMKRSGNQLRFTITQNP